MSEMKQYCVVIFTSTLAVDSDARYQEWSMRMEQLVVGQPGYISHFGFRDSQTRHRVTISYFLDEESIENWKALSEHLEAQQLGREDFYENYEVKVGTINREYGWSRES